MSDNNEILASGLPLPLAFVARMKEMLGEEFPAFAASYETPVTPSLRLNTRKVSVAEASDICPFLGEPVAWQGMGFYYGEDALRGDIRPGKHPLHEAGMYYIQEASAMLPASLCPPEPGERVLDLCAAPGGKATQLAAALRDEGLLVANEIHPTRASILSQNLERMGVPNALVTNATPHELAERFPAFFHRIVVDAPCSGEGMFRKEPDAVRMWSLENVDLCATRQGEILDCAARMLKPGGYLVYSTCTFAPEENEGAIMAFLQRHPDFSVVSSAEPQVVSARAAGILDGGRAEWVPGYGSYAPEIREAVTRTYRVLPHHARGEGHFAALLRRDVGDIEDIPSRPRQDERPGKQNRRKQESRPRDTEAYALFETFAREVWGQIPAFARDAIPCLFGNKLYLVPRSLGEHIDTAAQVRESLAGLRVLRAGLCVGTLVEAASGRGRLEPDHALSLSLAPGEGVGRFALESQDMARAYLRGESIPAPGCQGWYILTYQSLPLGWGKASGGVMKNHYPKGLRWND